MNRQSQDYTLFIADLHLKANDLATQRIFFNFLQGDVLKARALYILGDLFVYWAGDDDRSSFHEKIKAALREVSDKGISIFCLPGNRDFLLGEDFAKESGCKMLKDPCVIDLYGRPTLLTHGDSLCRSDILHQKINMVFRNKKNQKLFLKLPLKIRRIISQLLHILSSLRGIFFSKKRIIDEVRKEAAALSLCYNSEQIIHGHIHQCFIGTLPLINKIGRHIILKSWDQGAAFLVYLSDGSCFLL